jgi:anti-sigma factor RsiW
MTCLSELNCAVYVDGELSPEETREAERHLAECPRCRALVAALGVEGDVLRVALEEGPALAPLSATLVKPVPARGFQAVATDHHRAGAWILTVAALAIAWSLAALAGLAGVGELPSRSIGDWIGLAVEAGLVVLMNMAALEWILAIVAVVTMAGLALAGGVYLMRTPSRAIVMLALAIGVAAGVVPSRAEALEARRGRDVVVAAGETLDGTLVAAGKSVRVDGTIQGDLIVAAAHVEVRGTVRGDLVAAGATVDVIGAVDGSVYAAARSLTVRGHVGRGLYVANRSTTIQPEASVGGDLALVGRSVTLGGDAARGATILAHDAEVSGHVGRDVRFHGDRLAVRAPARVQGTIRADVHRASAVTVDDGAAVSGPVLTRVVSRAAGWHVVAPRAWFWVATSFFGAALLGWVGLVLAPALVVGSADQVVRWKRSLAWGIATLVGGPVAILLLAVTIVGLPLALVLLGLYLLGLYAAKIVVSLALGRTLIRPRGNPRRDALMALLVGLAVVTFATAVPLVGGPIRIVVACFGVGALAWRLARAAGVVRSSTA